MADHTKKILWWFLQSMAEQVVASIPVILTILFISYWSSACFHLFSCNTAIETVKCKTQLTDKFRQLNVLIIYSQSSDLCNDAMNHCCVVQEDVDQPPLTEPSRTGIPRSSPMCQVGRVGHPGGGESKSATFFHHK